MKKDQFIEIVEKSKDLGNLPNSEIISCLDLLSNEFETIKANIINMTNYLDDIELLYNKIHKEYTKRNP